jgi:hypothetical protein
MILIKVEKETLEDPFFLSSSLTLLFTVAMYAYTYIATLVQRIVYSLMTPAHGVYNHSEEPLFFTQTNALFVRRYYHYKNAKLPLPYFVTIL